MLHLIPTDFDPSKVKIPGVLTREYIVLFFKAKQCGTTQLNEDGQGSLK